VVVCLAAECIVGVPEMQPVVEKHIHDLILLQRQLKPAVNTHLSMINHSCVKAFLRQFKHEYYAASSQAC